MTTLTIKDLPMNKDLDHAALARVSGGIGRTPPQIRSGVINSLLTKYCENGKDKGENLVATGCFPSSTAPQLSKL